MTGCDNPPHYGLKPFTKVHLLTSFLFLSDKNERHWKAGARLSLPGNSEVRLELWP